MQAKRLTLVAGAETAFEFDRFYAKSVIVKNLTAGVIEFCDGQFDAAKSAVIPAFGWQTFHVTVPYDATPKFYVKAAAAGDVEIGFGSDGMGFGSGVFDSAGMLPHVLTLTQGEDTTLTVTLTHMGRVELDAPIALISGDILYSGDRIVVAVVGGIATVEGATELSEGAYRVDRAVSVVSVKEEEGV